MLFSQYFFNLTPTLIYICVLSRHEAKLMSKTKIFYRMRYLDASQCASQCGDSPGKKLQQNAFKIKARISILEELGAACIREHTGYFGRAGSIS